ncbi:cation-translocating P-type ATPase [Nocardia pneumoniae]|uniref:cation-translocating P-type ATPase n=1 Tax=Nocardia pneumoniae TaxID=228601 RepID=UPI0002E4C335|nr:cation-transporting P-type ATPase [Nocardia pneumoniae]
MLGGYFEKVLRVPQFAVDALRAPAAAADVLHTVLSDAVGHARAVWSGGDRLHVAVRGPAPDRMEAFAVDLTARVGRLPGVAWAGLDAGCGRLVVAAESPDALDAAAIIAAVEEAETAAAGPFTAAVATHPTDRTAAAWYTVAAVADLAAVGVATVGTLRRLPGRLTPIELAPVIAFVQNQERLRAPLERRFGVTEVELALGIAAATAGALERQLLSPVVDLVHRVLLLRQERSRAQTFAQVEPVLYATAPLTRPLPERPAPRPIPLPPGPIERYDEQDLMATVAAALTTIPRSHQTQGAIDVLSAGVAKAARLGREAFAAGVAEYLGRCGVLVVRPEPLRILDHIDRLVIDVDLLGDTQPPKPATGHDIEIVRYETKSGPEQGREDLTELVARLQREGHVVAVVAGGEEAALAAADCGVAVAPHPEHPVPWHADLIAVDGPVGGAAVLDACRLAQDISRHSVLLALAGSAASALILLGVPRPWRRRQALPVSLSVDVAALVALAHGRLSALRLLPPAPRAQAGDDWHRVPAAEVLTRLGSRPEGLTAPEADSRRPPPVAAPSAPRQLLAHVVNELRNPLTPVLAAGAALSVAVGSVLDAAMVAAVVFADAGIGALQQIGADRAVAALDRVAAQRVRVRRDGTEQGVLADELVVGDVIRLGPGEGVPADCRLLEAEGLEIDESALTGESLPVTKVPAPIDAEALADQTCMLFAGTAVATGRASAVVVAVGADTAAGRAAQGVTSPRTGVEIRLEALAARATPVALGAGVVTMAANFARGAPLAETLATGVSLTVAAVPESLPILATAAQLAGARRLAERGVLVRHKRAVEALGRVDVLCVDKTGTLTRGILRVTAVHDGRQAAAPDQLPSRHRRILAIAHAVAAATLPRRRRPGSTDDAIVTSATAARLTEPHAALAELTYESGRAYHAVVVPDEDGVQLNVVGAPETILSRCAHQEHPTSGHVEVDRHRRGQLDGLVEELAGDGGRVLAVATRRLAAPPEGELTEDDVIGLTLAGFLVLSDPPRGHAADALNRITRAGVRPVLISGDHPATARWLATEVGMLPASDGSAGVVTGPELDGLDDDALDAMLPGVSVCARVTPAHKVRLVAAYRRAGHCVAMTGDGVNDAAAIRLADVGIALGSGRGTEAARHAADVVLVEDHIGSIVDALIEGRALWVAVRDAVANLLGHNYGEIAVISGVSLLTGMTPLTARQLLLCNLFTDTIPALAIAMRPVPDLDPEHLLAEGPDRSIGPLLTERITVNGVATGLAGAGGYLAARLTGTVGRARTVTLLSIVGAQLGETAVLRPTDPVVVGAAAVSAAALLGIVETPGLSQLFGCRPVGPGGLLIAGTSAMAGAVGTLLFAPAAARHRDENTDPPVTTRHPGTAYLLPGDLFPLHHS